MQWGKTIVVNFDNYFESSQGHPKTVILDFLSIPTFINKLTTPLVFKSASIKRKKANVFSPILEVSDKNSRMFVDAVERINVTQLGIENHGNKI